MNKAILIGRLSRDIDLRFTQSGKAVANTAIAIEDGYGDQKKTHFFNIVVFGKFAETFAEWSFKGQQVAVEGRLVNETYERDGRNITATKIIAEQIKYLERKRTPEYDSPKGVDGEVIELDDLPW